MEDSAAAAAAAAPPAPSATGLGWRLQPAPAAPAGAEEAEESDAAAAAAAAAAPPAPSATGLGWRLQPAPAAPKEEQEEAEDSAAAAVAAAAVAAAPAPSATGLGWRLQPAPAAPEEEQEEAEDSAAAAAAAAPPVRGAGWHSQSAPAASFAAREEVREAVLGAAPPIPSALAPGGHLQPAAASAPVQPAAALAISTAAAPSTDSLSVRGGVAQLQQQQQQQPASPLTAGPEAPLPSTPTLSAPSFGVRVTFPPTPLTAVTSPQQQPPPFHHHQQQHYQRATTPAAADQQQATPHALQQQQHAPLLTLAALQNLVGELSSLATVGARRASDPAPLLEGQGEDNMSGTSGGHQGSDLSHTAPSRFPLSRSSGTQVHKQRLLMAPPPLPDLEHPRLRTRPHDHVAPKVAALGGERARHKKSSGRKAQREATATAPAATLFALQQVQQQQQESSTLAPDVSTRIATTNAGSTPKNLGSRHRRKHGTHSHSHTQPTAPSHPLQHLTPTQVSSQLQELLQAVQPTPSHTAQDQTLISPNRDRAAAPNLHAHAQTRGLDGHQHWSPSKTPQQQYSPGVGPHLSGHLTHDPSTDGLSWRGSEAGGDLEGQQEWQRIQALLHRAQYLAGKLLRRRRSGAPSSSASSASVASAPSSFSDSSGDINISSSNSSSSDGERGEKARAAARQQHNSFGFPASPPFDFKLRDTPVLQPPFQQEEGLLSSHSSINSSITLGAVAPAPASLDPLGVAHPPWGLPNPLFKAPPTFSDVLPSGASATSSASSSVTSGSRSPSLVPSRCCSRRGSLAGIGWGPVSPAAEEVGSMQMDLQAASALRERLHSSLLLALRGSVRGSNAPLVSSMGKGAGIDGVLPAAGLPHSPLRPTTSYKNPLFDSPHAHRKYPNAERTTEHGVSSDSAAEDSPRGSRPLAFSPLASPRIPPPPPFLTPSVAPPASPLPRRRPFTTAEAAPIAPASPAPAPAAVGATPRPTTSTPPITLPTASAAAAQAEADAAGPLAWPSTPAPKEEAAAVGGTEGHASAAGGREGKSSTEAGAEWHGEGRKAGGPPKSALPSLATGVGDLGDKAPAASAGTEVHTAPPRGAAAANGEDDGNGDEPPASVRIADGEQNDGSNNPVPLPSRLGARAATPPASRLPAKQPSARLRLDFGGGRGTGSAGAAGGGGEEPGSQRTPPVSKGGSPAQPGKEEPGHRVLSPSRAAAQKPSGTASMSPATPSTSGAARATAVEGGAATSPRTPATPGTLTRSCSSTKGRSRIPTPPKHEPTTPHGALPVVHGSSSIPSPFAAAATAAPLPSAHTRRHTGSTSSTPSPSAAAGLQTSHAANAAAPLPCPPIGLSPALQNLLFASDSESDSNGGSGGKPRQQQGILTPGRLSWRTEGEAGAPFSVSVGGPQAGRQGATRGRPESAWSLPSLGLPSSSSTSSSRQTSDADEQQQQYQPQHVSIKEGVEEVGGRGRAERRARGFGSIVGDDIVGEDPEGLILQPQQRANKQPPVPRLQSPWKRAHGRERQDKGELEEGLEKGSPRFEVFGSASPPSLEPSPPSREGWTGGWRELRSSCLVGATPDITTTTAAAAAAAAAASAKRMVALGAASGRSEPGTFAAATPASAPAGAKAGATVAGCGSSSSSINDLDEDALSSEAHRLSQFIIATPPTPPPPPQRPSDSYAALHARATPPPLSVPATPAAPEPYSIISISSPSTGDHLAHYSPSAATSPDAPAVSPFSPTTGAARGRSSNPGSRRASISPRTAGGARQQGSYAAAAAGVQERGASNPGSRRTSASPHTAAGTHAQGSNPGSRRTSTSPRAAAGAHEQGSYASQLARRRSPPPAVAVPPSPRSPRPRCSVCSPRTVQLQQQQEQQHHKHAFAGTATAHGLPSPPALRRPISRNSSSIGAPSDAPTSPPSMLTRSTTSLATTPRPLTTQQHQQARQQQQLQQRQQLKEQQRAVAAAAAAALRRSKPAPRVTPERQQQQPQLTRTKPHGTGAAAAAAATSPQGAPFGAPTQASQHLLNGSAGSQEGDQPRAHTVQQQQQQQAWDDGGWFFDDSDGSLPTTTHLPQLELSVPPAASLPSAAHSVSPKSSMAADHQQQQHEEEQAEQHQPWQEEEEQQQPIASVEERPKPSPVRTRFVRQRTAGAPQGQQREHDPNPQQQGPLLPSSRPLRDHPQQADGSEVQQQTHLLPQHGPSPLDGSQEQQQAVTSTPTSARSRFVRRKSFPAEPQQGEGEQQWQQQQQQQQQQPSPAIQLPTSGQRHQLPQPAVATAPPAAGNNRPQQHGQQQQPAGTASALGAKGRGAGGIVRGSLVSAAVREIESSWVAPTEGALRAGRGRGGSSGQGRGGPRWR
ncbi:hypothetical protein DUNSADRAFT_15553 [Dunaliella salina]|nr:hypothetical protein DUNSADRAFT_15553 [Dunaliella salina]KAF5829754.1 hypothetical protein DUNSADRAFT_15553 [Dunaliella salina]|eukprot:KAF5829753.1 hypothetical protein DUNSADRAFT_15553 [Dunaliella salina]